MTTVLEPDSVRLARLRFSEINDGVTQLAVKCDLGNSDKHKMHERVSPHLLDNI